MAAAHDAEALKRAIHDHWNAAPCGTRDLPREDRAAFFKALESERYQLEPYIRDFARFDRGRGLRVLEVGIGAGTDFVNWVRAGALATGIDLTERAVELTRERLDLEGLDAEVRVADAEALPFPDASFDRVFHVGGIAGYRAPARALAEMARVARPGTPIVVVDEQLDPSTPQSLYNRLTFRLVTFYDPDPHCPIEHVPASAREVRAEQLCRFFYCLSFRSAR